MKKTNKIYRYFAKRTKRKDILLTCLKENIVRFSLWWFHSARLLLKPELKTKPDQKLNGSTMSANLASTEKEVV